MVSSPITRSPDSGVNSELWTDPSHRRWPYRMRRMYRRLPRSCPRARRPSSQRSHPFPRPSRQATSQPSGRRFRQRPHRRERQGQRRQARTVRGELIRRRCDWPNETGDAASLGDEQGRQQEASLHPRLGE